MSKNVFFVLVRVFNAYVLIPVIGHNLLLTKHWLSGLHDTVGIVA